jgi:DNA-directed RNA polymerase specialized sigma24 family protein
MNEQAPITEEEIGELRRSAFALAHRMLGSVSDADDVVREGLLRVYRAGERGERIEFRPCICQPWSRAWHSTSFAQRAPGARLASETGCPSHS